MAFWANSMATVPAEIAWISLYFSLLSGICQRTVRSGLILRQTLKQNHLVLFAVPFTILDPAERLGQMAITKDP
jgi:hypothetical protein